MERLKEQFLLFRIRSFKDAKSFEVFVKEYGPRIQKFLDLRLPTSDDAQDAYVETWTRIWVYAQNTKIESFSGLLFSVARSVIAGYYMDREKKPLTIANDSERKIDIGVPLHYKTMEKVDVELLKKYIKELDELDAEVIYLKYLEGYKLKEIAAYLGKTEGSTSMMIHRAIIKLREIIKEKFGDGSI